MTSTETETETDTIITLEPHKPIITLIGEEKITIMHGQEYLDQGVTTESNDIENLIISIDSDINTNIIGIYTITYTATDSNGLSDSTQRTVIVTDQSAPVITINGNSTINLFLHDEYIDLGATAVDNVDKDLDLITYSNLNTLEVGTYQITYSATDNAGNTSSKERTVIISDNSTIDISISLNGAETVNLLIGETYDELGAIANTNVELPITINGHVDTNTAGTYILSYSATSSNGQTKTIIRTINVEAHTPFITTWKTNNSGSSNNFSISIGTFGDGYDYQIDWGDGSSTDLNVTGKITHIYSSPGTYTVSISGKFPRIFFSYGNDNLKLLSIEQWGNQRWKSMSNAFFGCKNLVINATDTPDLSQVTDMSNMFQDAKALNQDINHWDVSNITNMFEMFKGASIFNQPIDQWNVSSVINMSNMFNSALQFNQNINSWDVSSVIDMSNMFSAANSFNHPLDKWNVSNVENMQSMFNYALLFDQDIGNWDVSKVSDMTEMFNKAELFNQNINNWEVSSVSKMTNMFSEAFSFNQPMNNWDVSSVIDMSYMFYKANSFNQDINYWDVSSVTNMNSMFSNNRSFDQSIGGWNVSKVITMTEMFARATLFNQPIDNWDVSAVTNMDYMFHGAINFNQDIGSWTLRSINTVYAMFRDANEFNQDISNWNVSSLIDMSAMFYNASSFNQDLSSWDISNVTDMRFTFSGSNLSTNNYDLILQGWSSLLTIKSNVSLGMGSIQYSNESQNARDILTNTYSWSISDGGVINSL